MLKKLLPLFILILSVGAFFAYKWLTPTNFKQLSTITSPQAVTAIKAYAAVQFGVSEDKVKILNSKKEEWQDICLGITIPDYKCTKAKTTGYEATVEANGYKTIYRSNDDGSIIRVVK